MTDIAALKAANAARWKVMHTTPALSIMLDQVAGRFMDSDGKVQIRCFLPGGGT